MTTQEHRKFKIKENVASHLTLDQQITCLAEIIVNHLLRVEYLDDVAIQSCFDPTTTDISENALKTGVQACHAQVQTSYRKT